SDNDHSLHSEHQSELWWKYWLNWREFESPFGILGGISVEVEGV
ncbi:hypothetical protein A2U01_0041091, partial [Trifolium medium]|nr:hypothetical protein [Trifolium medium]